MGVRAARRRRRPAAHRQRRRGRGVQRGADPREAAGARCVHDPHRMTADVVVHPVLPIRARSDERATPHIGSWPSSFSGIRTDLNPDMDPFSGLALTLSMRGCLA